MNKLYKILFALRRHERAMLRVPRQYANIIEPGSVSHDDALVMGRSSARSPQNVKQLMKLYHVNTVDELLPLLPDQRYKRRVRARLISFFRGIEGAQPHDPDNTLRRRLRRAGYYDHQDVLQRIDEVREFR